MADDNTQASSAPPPAPSKASGDSKSPLDILEELLQESKGKGQNSAKPAGVDPDSQSDPQAAAAAAAKEEVAVDAQKRAEIEAQIIAQNQADQLKMQQMELELSQIKETPQYQAKVNQEQQVQAEVAQENADHAGHEIVQLGHTKV